MRTMQKGNKNFFAENWKDIISIVISIIALGLAIYSNSKSIRLQEKYNTLSTYGMRLNYQVEISNKVGEGNFQFDDCKINAGKLDVISKTGGIEKVYAIHYYKDNVKAILPVDLYVKDMENYDAQDTYYSLTGYTIDKIAEKSDVYYGTLYLVIKDYQNNCFTNMIVYEINKEDMSDFDTRVYSEIDLLHMYNKDINVLPEFDASQMEEYHHLKSKLDEIL